LTVKLSKGLFLIYFTVFKWYVLKESLLFETERLLIRPTNTEDGEFIYQLVNTPKWLKFIGDRNVTSPEVAENYIKTRMLTQLEKLGFSNFTVIRKSDGVKVGTCGLYDREGLEGIDIGFAFLPEYEGFGYGFESADRIKKAAFEQFGLTELVAITMKDNFVSQKLLEKLGLSKTGITKVGTNPEEFLLYTVRKLPE
jgi:ribosomal-protein-alanine N-acetyltransferase